MHEILHTLGFYHEQSRNDRDQYVFILLNNVRDGKKHNFKKHLSSRAESSYDFASIMHYSRKAFGKKDPATGNTLETIVARIEGQTIGQRGGLSNLDIEGLRSAYPDEDSPSGGSLPNTCANAPTLFQDVGFQGQQFSAIENQINLHDSNYGDKASSLCVPAGWSIIVHESANYGGSRLIITGPESLDKFESSWNDKISSILIVNAPEGSQPTIKCPTVTLYEHVDFRGRQISYPTNTNKTSLGGWNDKYSSTCIPAGMSVDLYQHSNYGGQKYQVRGPKNIAHMGKLPGNWNDKASSLRVYTGSAPSRLVSCSVPTFYEHVNFGGGKVSYPTNTNRTSLGGWNDKFSSVCIPAGMGVDLYEHSKYRGKKYSIRGPRELQNLGSVGWNDKASSLMVGE